MEPTLLIGDRLFVTKYSYGFSKHSFPFSPPILRSRIFSSEPNRGDVVVFKPPFDNGRDFVKRIIGIPGDTVAILEGTVFVNEKPLYEPYIQKSGNGNMLPQKVTDGG